MRRKLLTALAAALTIYGGIFYGITQALDNDFQADW